MSIVINNDCKLLFYIELIKQFQHIFIFKKNVLTKAFSFKARKNGTFNKKRRIRIIDLKPNQFP